MPLEDRLERSEPFEVLRPVGLQEDEIKRPIARGFRHLRGSLPERGPKPLVVDAQQRDMGARFDPELVDQRLVGRRLCGHRARDSSLLCVDFPAYAAAEARPSLRSGVGSALRSPDSPCQRATVDQV